MRKYPKVDAMNIVKRLNFVDFVISTRLVDFQSLSSSSSSKTNQTRVLLSNHDNKNSNSNIPFSCNNLWWTKNISSIVRIFGFRILCVALSSSSAKCRIFHSFWQGHPRLERDQVTVSECISRTFDSGRLDIVEMRAKSEKEIWNHKQQRKQNENAICFVHTNAFVPL